VEAFKDEELSWEPIDDIRKLKECRVAVYSPFEKDEMMADRQYRESFYEWVSKNVLLFREIATKFIIR
jgi:hypothetical protein